MPPFPASSLSFSRTAAFSFTGKPARESLSAKVVAHNEVSDKAHALRLLGDAEQTIARQAERIRQLENLSITDELTGLLNRRGLMNILRRELGAARRNKRNNGLLILIDLDGFKQINDQYGHAVGDAYLQAAAAVLLNEVRTSDYVARFGGDEFALVLTQISPKETAARINQLSTAFNKRFMHERGLSLPLKASFGFALLSETETPESLTVAADMKLYADKAQRAREEKKENRNLRLT